MKILVAPNAYKGSLSSLEASKALAAGLLEANQSLQVLSCPFTDGGTGSLEVVENIFRGRKVHFTGKDVYGEKRIMDYIVYGGTCFIESARPLGLDHNLSKSNKVLSLSSFALGEMILDALKKKPKTITIFLGGTATNDLGLGCLEALGMAFFGQGGKKLDATIANFESIEKNQTSGLGPLLKGVSVEIIVDVKNRLLGPRGASLTFAPQKGADESAVITLESSLKHIRDLIKTNDGFDLDSLKGGGAAGGLGAGLAYFLKAPILDGSEYMAKLIGLREKVASSDLVIAGEGRVDKTSFDGKALGYLFRLSKKEKKKLIIVGGSFSDEIKECISDNDIPTLDLSAITGSVNASMGNPKEALRKAGVILGSRF